MKKFYTLALLFLCFLGYSQKNAERPYVVMVSFDGFRSDYVERFNLPNFKKFIKDGASSEALIPSFPSKTFPNHYTLVTGLYPGHHGLVDNVFYDPKKEMTYGMKIREAVLDSAFYGGVPLWVLAKQQGLKSASYFWVGSELKQESLHPDYFLRYDQKVPFEDRIDQVIKWLQLPEVERPHLITLYFSSPDTESHAFGPLAEKTKLAVMRMDSLLGDLVRKIEVTQLPVNTVVVSDHGMSELVEGPGTFILLDDLVKTTGKSVIVANGGTQAHIYTSTTEKGDSLYALLKSRADGFDIYKRKDFPSKWNYDHFRSGDLLIVAKPGKYLMNGDQKAWIEKTTSGKLFGAHGYDPDEVTEMYGIFYAKGPNIKRGVKIPSLENIHIYPFVCKLLGLSIPVIDGDPKATENILK